MAEESVKTEKTLAERLYETDLSRIEIEIRSIENDEGPSSGEKVSEIVKLKNNRDKIQSMTPDEYMAKSIKSDRKHYQDYVDNYQTYLADPELTKEDKKEILDYVEECKANLAKSDYEIAEELLAYSQNRLKYEVADLRAIKLTDAIALSQEYYELSRYRLASRTSLYEMSDAEFEEVVESVRENADLYRKYEEHVNKRDIDYGVIARVSVGVSAVGGAVMTGVAALAMGMKGDFRSAASLGLPPAAAVAIIPTIGAAAYGGFHTACAKMAENNLNKKGLESLDQIFPKDSKQDSAEFEA